MKKFKRISSFFIALTIILSVFSITSVENVYGATTYEYDDFLNGVMITDCNNPTATLNIPGTLGGKKVLGIDDDAFSEYDEIITVTIPDTVEYIGDSAFFWCDNLTTVNIGNGVKYIGNSCFIYCDKLKTVNVGSNLRCIGGGAFLCKSLKSISLPNTVTRIGRYAIGYYEDDDTEEVKKVNDFQIKGYTGSPVEKYATLTSKTFVSRGKYTAPAEATNYIYYTKNNRAYIYKYLGNQANVVVPDKLGGKPVVSYDTESYPFDTSDYAYPEGVFGSVYDKLSSITFPKTMCFEETLSDCRPLPQTVVIPKDVKYINFYTLGFYSRQNNDDSDDYDDLTGMDSDYLDKADNFKIKGYTNSVAYIYAEYFDIKFESMGTLTEDDPAYIAKDYGEYSGDIWKDYDSDCYYVENQLYDPVNPDSFVLTKPEEPKSSVPQEPESSVPQVTSPNDDPTEITTVSNSTETQTVETTTTVAPVVTTTSIITTNPTTTTVTSTTKPEKPTYTLPTVTIESTTTTPVEPKELSLNKSYLSLMTGKSFKLSAKVTPNCKNKINWSSSNGNIVKVNSNGYITALRPGVTTITASVEGSDLTANCLVSVKKAVTKIKLNKTLVNVTKSKNKKFTLIATVAPTSLKNKIQWSTSNKKVATVNNGKVIVKKKGCAVITCKATDGSGTFAKCTVINGKKAKSVRLNLKSKILSLGKSVKLKATVNGGVCKNVVWTSSNNSVATVNNGTVKALKEGKATITATATDGSKKNAKCVITVNGHKYGSWKTIVSPTCQKEGLARRVCSTCKNEQTKKIPTSTHHNWENKYVVKTEPTCTSVGLAELKCSDCGLIKDSYTIPSLGHYFSESVVTKKATCKEEGEITKFCLSCGKKEVKSIPKTPHWGPFINEVEKSATCVSEGRVATICSICGTTIGTHSIPKTEHKYVKETLLRKAGIGADGVATSSCFYCETPKNRIIPAVSKIAIDNSTFIYNGKEQKPVVTVTDINNKSLTNGTDYTVTYHTESKDVNKYKLTVTLAGEYEGSRTFDYMIKPNPTEITTCTSTAKSQVNLGWKLQSTQTSGYLVKYSLYSDIENNSRKSFFVTNPSTVSQTVTGLTSGSTYYFEIYAYKTITVDGVEQRVYSAVSPVKSVKVL